MDMLPAPNCEVYIQAPVQERTPLEEYIAILRSYLSKKQKGELRRTIEVRCAHEGMISPIEYAEALQAHLTPWQKAGVVERLESLFSSRGLID